MLHRRFTPYAPVLALLLALVIGLGAQAAEVVSPDGRITVEIDTGFQVRYSVHFDEHQIIDGAAVGMTLADGRKLGSRPEVLNASLRTIDETITPVVAEKRNRIRNHCNELRIDFDGDYALVVRAYNDGVAWRWETGFTGEVTVESEEASFAFAGDWEVMRTSSKTYQTSFESNYEDMPLSEWEAGALAFAPLLVTVPDGPRLVITEADLRGYPGMFLTRHRRGNTTLVGSFAPYPAEEKQVDDRHIRVMAAEDFMATCAGTRTYPWRVIGMAQEDTQLVESTLVYRLAPECALGDTAWIKPGKVAWDWWNWLNVWGVDFEAGVNSDTYKHYIDFAAENGIEYIILDEGWSDTRDLTALKPTVDLKELLAYGKERGVGLILWCVWCTLDRQRAEVLPLFEEWGVAGVKVDFMDRDDQKVVAFYERMAKATAQHHLLLDFHGSYKPTGLRRMYPNLITREGVVGLEYSKWSDMSDPEYCVSIPFIRQFAGPMDYTPGAMNNATKQNFRAVMHRPMSQGTRAHQVAMYVVYESPVQMLADTPTAYRENPDCLDFIAQCPTTWDETMCLMGEVGEYVVVARQKGDGWYLGAMTSWHKRKVDIPLDFLGEGEYEAVIVRDGVNASRIGIDHIHETRRVTAGDTLEVHLAQGGGYAVRFDPKAE